MQRAEPDVLRPEAKNAVAAMRHMGLTTVLLSGDSQSVTSSVGRDLGVDEAVGELLPEQNAKWVTDLRQKNRKVAMVGDGINRLFIFEIVPTRPARPCSIARRTRENSRSSVLWA